MGSEVAVGVGTVVGVGVAVGLAKRPLQPVKKSKPIVNKATMERFVDIAMIIHEKERPNSAALFDYKRLGTQKVLVP
jgi:hypothetical protein